MSNKLLAGLNLALAASFLTLAASGAFAFELTDGIRLDNTVTSIYSVENDVFNSDFESELVYGVNPNLSAHVLADFDLNDVEFTELRVGVEYTPVQINGLTLSAYSIFDSSVEYTDTELSLELKF